MDLSKILDHEQLFELDLVHPITQEPTGVIFKVRSIESPHVKDAMRKTANGYIDKRPGKMTAEKLEREHIERMAATVASWDWGEFQWDGKVPEFTPENVTKVLAEGWVFEQVAKVAETRENFTGKPVKV